MRSLGASLLLPTLSPRNAKPPSLPRNMMPPPNVHIALAHEALESTSRTPSETMSPAMPSLSSTPNPTLAFTMHSCFMKRQPSWTFTLKPLLSGTSRPSSLNLIVGNYNKWVQLNERPCKAISTQEGGLNWVSNSSWKPRALNYH